jgi:hypothetical protein
MRIFPNGHTGVFPDVRQRIAACAKIPIKRIIPPFSKIFLALENAFPILENAQNPPPKQMWQRLCLAYCS